MTGSVKPPLELKKRRLSNLQQQLPNFSLGADGEASAVSFLRAKGYVVLDTNVRIKNTEVDIVALDTKQDEVVFVEVKTRSQAFYGDPSRAVGYTKLRAMQTVARSYCRERHLDKDYRFDIISILPGQIEHFENVTWSRLT